MGWETRECDFDAETRRRRDRRREATRKRERVSPQSVILTRRQRRNIAFGSARSGYRRVCNAGTQRGSTWEARDEFPRRDAKTLRQAQRTHFGGGWRVHFAVWGGSGSGSGDRRASRGSPFGRKRGSWPGRLPAGLSFGGFGGFGSGGLRVSVASGWVSVTGSFGNSWRRALSRSNSSMARR